MAQLAIKGHETRGKEVIEILEMLGAKNLYQYFGDDDEAVYYIKGVDIDVRELKDIESYEFVVYTLEEFLEKYPYKVGDKVKTLVNGYCGVYDIQDMGWFCVSKVVKYRILDFWLSAENLQAYKEGVVTPKEKKELLLRDLSARLSYGVVVDYAHNAFDLLKGLYLKIGSKCILTCSLLDVFITPRQYEQGEYIKPYLIPLSSMTEEQSKIYHELIGGMFGTNALICFEALEDFFHKNHLDYRGLIPMGLAIDATGLNIYKS